jgi:hypothetical protein
LNRQIVRGFNPFNYLTITSLPRIEKYQDSCDKHVIVNPKPSTLDTLIDQFLNYLLVEKGLSQKTLEAYTP